MQISVSRGPGRQQIIINIAVDDRVSRIMELIKERLDIPTERQRLRLNNTALDRNCYIYEYNISNGTLLHLQVTNSRPVYRRNNGYLGKSFEKRQSINIRRKKYRAKTVIQRRVII